MQEAVRGYEPSGREFESLRARQLKQRVTSFRVWPFVLWVAVWVAIGAKSPDFRSF